MPDHPNLHIMTPFFRVSRRHFLSSVSSLLALGVLAVGIVRAETLVRSVVLETSRDEAVEVRARLNHTTEGLKMAAIDAEGKVKGVRKVVDISTAGPWDRDWNGGPLRMKESSGTFDFNGEKRDMQIILDFTNFRAGRNGVSHMFSSYFELMETPKRTCDYWGHNRGVTVTSGKWQEMTMWSDDKHSVMLWQFVVADTALEEIVESENCGILEIRLYQASVEDIALLGKSKPDTREKAIAWLSGRAKLWRETRMLIADGQDSSYMSSDADHKIRDGETAVEGDTLEIDAKIKREGDRRQLTCDVAHRGNEKDREYKKTITGDLPTGLWEMHQLDGCTEANLVVYRLEAP